MADLGLKLYYFPARSRAEAVRMLFKYTKIPFEDVHISFKDFMKMKPTLPDGKVPVLEVKGKWYPESGSILRFVGKLSGTTPSDPVEFLAADAAYELSRSMTMIDPIVNRFDIDTAKEKAKTLFEEAPTKLKTISTLLGEKLFFGGDAPCFADFGVWHYLDNIESIRSGTVKEPNLLDWMKRVSALPGVAEYLAERSPIKPERLTLFASL